MRLAGTYHPIPFLLEKIPEYLPGVSQVAALWMDYNRSVYSTEHSGELNQALKIKAQKIRTQKNKIVWTKPQGIFENISSHNQLSIADEDEANVLYLYFPSPVDQLYDMIMITFPQHVFLKNLDKTFNGISSQEKLILGKLLSSILLSEYQRTIKERHFLQQIEGSYSFERTKIQELEENLKSTQQLYTSSLRTIVNDFIVQLEEKYHKTFRISDAIIFRLAKSQLSISSIQEIIENAVIMAFHLHISQHEIEIQEHFIQLNLKKKPVTPPKKNISAHQSVVDLLNRYEEAAQRANQNGLVVNGKNVAASLNPPVTPPAITDAVKKKKRKIAYLLEQYPNKWQHIRSGIKPISELDNESGFLKKSS